MDILSIKNKGLKRLIEGDDAKSIPSDLEKRIRKIMTALISTKNIEGLSGLPGWKIHQLTGDRVGTWSISVNGNWRITFDIVDEQISNLDLEDYH